MTPQDTVTLSDATEERQAVDWSLQEMIDDIVALKTLMQQETEYLKKLDMAAVKSLNDTKLRLVKKLELQKALIARNPSLLEDLSIDQKQQLATVHEGFETVIRENFHETLKAREINRVVVEAVSLEYNKYEQRATAYGNDGGLSKKIAPAASQPVSAVALNETI